MRFYMIYSNQFAVGNKPIGIASLAAITKQAGHSFKLFDCTQFSVIKNADYNEWSEAGVKRLAFMESKNAERLPERKKLTYSQIIEKVIEEIKEFKPDIIGLTALTDDYPLGLRIFEKVKKAFPSTPTIAGGVHATIDPVNVIAQDCFDMLCVGEGEYVMLDIGKRIDEKKDFFGIKNLWIKRKDGTVEKNLVSPYEQNLDKFPFPDWSIYPKSAFYKPYKGYVYKYGDFEMSRGCPYKCSYCINVQLQSIYKQTGEKYHREKSIPRVIDEIKTAVKKYDIEFLRFYDETFLLMSNERLEEFANLYSKEVGIPFTIETTSQSITPFTAKMLKKANCVSASLGLETGSPDIRNGLLHKPTENDVYLKAFKLLEENGIQKVSFNMLGLPYEKLEDIFKTIAMNKLCNTDVQSLGTFYPYQGTPIRRMLKEKKMLNEDNEKELLQGYDFNTLASGGKSALTFRDMDDNVLTKMNFLFANYTVWPVTLWPLLDLIRHGKEDAKFIELLWGKINAITYFKKFKEWPLKHKFPPAPKEDLKKYEFSVEKANDLVKLLIQNWGEEFREKFLEKITLIKEGTLRPEFPIPEEYNELKKFLGVEKTTTEEKRDIRLKLRKIAKEDTAVYEPESQPAMV